MTTSTPTVMTYDAALDELARDLTRLASDLLPEGHGIDFNEITCSAIADEVIRVIRDVDDVSWLYLRTVLGRYSPIELPEALRTGGWYRTTIDYINSIIEMAHGDLDVIAAGGQGVERARS